MYASGLYLGFVFWKARKDRVSEPHHSQLCSVIMTDNSDVLELLRCVTGTFHTAESSQESCTKLVVKASIFVMRAAAVWVSVDEQDIVVRAALRSLLHSLEDAMAYNDDLADQLSNAGVLHDLHAAGLLVFDIRPKEVVKDLDAEVYLHPAVYLVEEALRRG
jgi:hypothetical protein